MITVGKRYEFELTNRQIFQAPVKEIRAANGDPDQIIAVRITNAQGVDYWVNWVNVTGWRESVI